MSTKHTAEPWQVGSPYRFGPQANTLPIVGGNAEVCTLTDALYTDRRANAARIVQCVNACAGIEDPASALKQAREALHRMATDREAMSHLSGHDRQLVLSALAALGKG